MKFFSISSSLDNINKDSIANIVRRSNQQLNLTIQLLQIIFRDESIVVEISISQSFKIIRKVNDLMLNSQKMYIIQFEF